MKKVQFILLSILILGLVGCWPNDPDPVDGENISFLAYYSPGADQVLGSEKAVAEILVRDGQSTYSYFLDILPASNYMTKSADINNNILVLGAKQEGVQPNGVYMDLDNREVKYLPLVQPSQDDDYAYFQTETGEVTDNGYIIYSSATNDINYGDQYQPYLMRFNPENGNSVKAISPTAFVLAQPEKGSDTEIGLLSRSIFGSPDGKYAYGSVNGLGTSGGSIHWDYSILYRYDFETEAYKRLGDPEDDDVSIQGMTTDRKYLVYSNGSDRKVLNIETNETYPTEMNTINVRKSHWGDRGPCVATTSGNLLYKDFVANIETTVCYIPGGDIGNVEFSLDGNRIYFILEGYDTNYLCLTDGLSEGSSYDTLSSLPKEFKDMILVR